VPDFGKKKRKEEKGRLRDNDGGYHGAVPEEGGGETWHMGKREGDAKVNRIGAWQHHTQKRGGNTSCRPRKKKKATG